jgi:hypothetical protein
MKRKEDGPLISTIFKGFSILSGFLALVGVIILFSADPSARAAAFSAAVGTYVGGALCLWWMGDVAQWLWEIARNTKQGAAVAERTPAKRVEQPAAFKRIEQPTASHDDPPSYQL